MPWVKKLTRSKRRWRVMGVSLLLLLVGVFLVATQMNRYYQGPTIDGYSMGYWFDQYCVDPSGDGPKTALIQFGAELAPFLIERLQSPDSRLRDRSVTVHRKLHQLFPSLRQYFPVPPSSEETRAHAQNALKFVTLGARPFIEPESKDRKDAIVTKLIEGLKCDDTRVIRAHYRKLPSGERVPMTIHYETIQFSVNVLGLMRRDASAALPHLKSLLSGAPDDLLPSIEITIERIEEAIWAGEH